MKEIEQITEALTKFRDQRDWQQFHNPKDLALALSIEASELLEEFLWIDSDKADQDKVKDELADVFAYAFLLAEKYDFDVKEIVLQKMEKNVIKYPLSKT